MQQDKHVRGQAFVPSHIALNGSSVPHNLQGWMAQLSDKSFVWEMSYTGVHGELSPWQKLIDDLHRRNLSISTLWLRRGNICLSTVSGAEGYFQAYMQQVSLNAAFAQDLQGIGSVHGSAVIVQWVNHLGDVYQSLEPLDSMILHTTLRQPNDLLTKR